MVSSLKVRLNRHFVACSAMAAAAVVTGVASQSQAAIVSSGIRNIPIPANIDGVYVNIVTGATGTSAGAVPGYDINPYATSTGASFFTNSSAASDATQRGYLAASATGAVLNLPFGTIIDGMAGTFNTGVAAGTNFTPGTEGLFGFRFKLEPANTTHVGWARIIVPTGSTAPTTAGLLVEWAYEDQAGVGIAAGNIPTPGAAGLVAAGMLGGLRRRRR